MTDFGPIKDKRMLEDRVKALLKKWMPTYLAEIERQNGVEAGGYPAPKAYEIATRINNLVDAQTPYLILISPRMPSPPQMDGEGKYFAWWNIFIGVVTETKDNDSSQTAAGRYAAAVRAILLNRQSLKVEDGDEAFAEECEWRGEQYDDILTEEGEATNLAAARVLFAYKVPDVAMAGAGPTQPDPLPDPTEPYEPDPEVETHEESIDVKEDD